MSPTLQRAALLLEQDRPGEAETTAREAIAEDNQDASGFFVLSQALLMQEKRKEAREAAEQAISLAPHNAAVHQLLGRVEFSEGKLKAAHAAFNEAIRLDPRDPHPPAFRAMTFLRESQWQKALDEANRALQLDPEHEMALHARAHAQRQLGQPADAEGTLEGALAKHPHNSNLHAQVGYNKLRDQNRQEALDHFGEALRLDPNNAYAREGLIMALKAKNPLYGLLLRYIFFMSRLSPGLQIGVLIGGYVAFRVAESAFAAAGLPQLALVVAILWIFLVILTWAGDSFFDLTLRLSPYGRLALTDERKFFANLTGAALGCALLLGIGTFLTNLQILFYAALACMLLVAPISVTRASAADRRKTPALIGLFAAGLIVLGLAAFLSGFDVESGQTIVQMTFFGLALFTWFGNALVIRER